MAPPGAPDTSPVAPGVLGDLLAPASSCWSSSFSPPQSPQSPLLRPRAAPGCPAASGGSIPLQAYQLPQPGKQLSLPLSLAPHSPLEIRRTHSFGPALESTGSSSSSNGSSGVGSPASALARSPMLPFPFPAPAASASTGRRAPPPPPRLRARRGVASGLAREAGQDEGVEEEGQEQEQEGTGGGGSSSSQGGSQGSGGAPLLRLVPIDHGFSLPHPLLVDETELCWLHWVSAGRLVAMRVSASLT